MSTEWLERWPGVLRDEPVARHSQYGVGGPADFYLASSDDGMLRELVVRCAAESVPLTMLGAGSNTLVLDGGIRGLAVRIIDKRVAVQGDHVCLAAGAMMPRVALDLARRGIGGMEWGIGVPGSCGASVWGNAGAFDSDVAGTLVDCDVLAPDGTVQRVRASDCGFAYRDSRLRRDLAGHVVLRGRFAVSHQDVAAVRARTDAIQAERKRTQPYGVRSLGSTFKNPPDDFAGRLIEAAGLKGRTHGGAQISPKHANFILNIANATAADVLALVEVAREAVAERFDVVLEREIVVLGEPATLAIEAVPR